MTQIRCYLAHPVTENVILKSSDPQAIIGLFVEPKFDAHVRDWHFECYRTRNYHFWPQYSNRIVYGSREAAHG